MINCFALHREQGKSKRKSYWQAAHCILEICHFTQLKSKYMSCLIVLEISSASLWVLTSSWKHLVVFVLLSILFVASYLFCVLCSPNSKPSFVQFVVDPQQIALLRSLLHKKSHAALCCVAHSLHIHILVKWMMASVFSCVLARACTTAFWRLVCSAIFVKFSYTRVVQKVCRLIQMGIVNFIDIVMLVSINSH